MGKKIIWASDALEQLEDIHFYILFESKSIHIADKVIDKIFESTEILKTSPEIYKLDSKKTNNDGSFRAFEEFKYRVVYKITEDQIRILRVRHTSREPIEY